MRARRPASLALALLLGGSALAACGGGGDVTRDSLRDDIAGWLTDPGDEGSSPDPLSESDADIVATCVANAVFDDSVDDPFTRDERNDIASADSDGEEADPDLADRFVSILDDCREEAEAPS